jgi:hypothetical protein
MGAIMAKEILKALRLLVGPQLFQEFSFTSVKISIQNLQPGFSWFED